MLRNTLNDVINDDQIGHHIATIKWLPTNCHSDSIAIIILLVL